MSMQFSGVLSGIDFSTIVDATVAANRAPLTRLESRRTQYQQESGAVSDIDSRMTHLLELTETLSDMSNLRDVTGTSSDTDILSVRTSDGAAEGTYTVEVGQMAMAEKEVHRGVADPTADLGGGTFVYQYGTDTRTLSLRAGGSLEDLRDLINNDPGNPGVRASILEYDDGLGGVYHLVLSGQDTGTDHSITIDAGTTLTDFGPGGDWTETQTAQNAHIRVDGYPADPAWIERSSNSITDVIPDVTLELHTTGTATATMNRNNNQLKTHLSNLVEMYNGIVDRIDVYTGYDEETETSGIMQGDSLMYGTLQRVRRTLVGSVDGFDADQDSFTMLADIGLEIDRDGHLSLDEPALDDALSEDYLGVLKLIGASGLGGTDNAGLQFDSALSSTQAGLYDVEIDYDATGAITDARIKLEGESEWRSMTINGMTVTGASGNPEQGMSLTVVSGGVSETVSYQARMQHGFASAAYDVLDELMDPTDGAFATKSSQIDSAIETLNRQIEIQEVRLEALEERLTERYARLEATLAELESQNAAFESLFQSIEANQKTIRSKS